MNTKQVLGFTLATIIASQNCQTIFAGEKGGVSKSLVSSDITKVNSNELHISTKDFNPQQKEFLSKLNSMLGEFCLKDNKLALKISLDDLQKKYSLNDYDMSIINKMLHIQSNGVNCEKPNLQMWVSD